jgi:hypothetical protein
MDTDILQKTVKAFYDILMSFHQENSDVYTRDENWHKDFINMPLVIKALEKTYSDSGQDAVSRWHIFSGEITKLHKAGKLFTKYTNSNFPPNEHKMEIIRKFTYEFLSINKVRLTTRR